MGLIIIFYILIHALIEACVITDGLFTDVNKRTTAVHCQFIVVENDPSLTINLNFEFLNPKRIFAFTKSACTMHSTDLHHEHLWRSNLPL